MTKTRLHIVIPTELKAALQALADAGNRPLSREVRKALEDHVNKGYGRAA